MKECVALREAIEVDARWMAHRVKGSGGINPCRRLALAHNGRDDDKAENSENDKISGDKGRPDKDDQSLHEHNDGEEDKEHRCQQKYPGREKAKLLHHITLRDPGPVCPFILIEATDQTAPYKIERSCPAEHKQGDDPRECEVSLQKKPEVINQEVPPEERCTSDHRQNKEEECRFPDHRPPFLPGPRP